MRCPPAPTRHDHPRPVCSRRPFGERIIDADTFIQRWQASGGAERANYQLFLTELCDLLDVPRPEPTSPDDRDNRYVFEKAVTFRHPDGSTTTGRIDLYRRGCFVCETKQGSEAKRTAEDLALGVDRSLRTGHGLRGSKRWDDAMIAARAQAENYVRCLPDDNPPFLLVVDVGYTIEVYADFSRLGKVYTPFPSAQAHRIPLDRLRDPDVRARLRQVWLDPLALDPSRISAKVTREIASKLARLAKSLESDGHAPEAVAHFLMRCLFTAFAEDVKLLPERAFVTLLSDAKAHVDQLPDLLRALWAEMDRGGFSAVLRQTIWRFNGGLFSEQTALPLTPAQIDILLEAARADWRDVEPAIFGTLLERALDPDERHKLGAHYTPRAYVERLVLPTIIEPLREDWDAARTAALTIANREVDPTLASKARAQARARIDADARAQIHDFLRKLAGTVVLDPACGSGNFLYVAMAKMKELEAEARDLLAQLGEDQGQLERASEVVDPNCFKGIEINPRAAAIAEIVLWIGYLQWHFRTHGGAPPEQPILKDYHNIERRDAVLAYDRCELVTDEHGKSVTRWDGQTMKKHPVTGEDVPDDSARTPVYRYVNPRKAQWPKADFIVSNPPYLGVRKFRATAGDAYVDAYVAAYPEVPETSDMVMYWWHKAADAVEHGLARRFGLITTNSITQAYSRPLVEQHLRANPGTLLVFAIADHPWVDSADGAAVDVAMTVGAAQSTRVVPQVGHFREANPTETSEPLLTTVESISSRLTGGTDVGRALGLRSNELICFQGVIPGNEGFKLRADEYADARRSVASVAAVLKPYIIGKDLVGKPEAKWVVDTFGLSEDDLRTRYPSLYQRLLNRVKPERDHNSREVRRRNWWLFAENAPKLRQATSSLSRFICTPNTAKHRPFVFVDGGTLPDAMAYAVASNDAFHLGVLSSRVHVTWALYAGGTLEDRPRYNSKATFAPFPFPDATEAQKARIRDLGEQLDAHRKRQQAAHPGLTITDLYNVLAKLRAGETLTAKERATHDQGLVSVLRQLHDDLDAAVFDAYGWPAGLTDEQILERLVALNHQRAEEEKRGIVRWLRPEFQIPRLGKDTQTELDLDDDEPDAKPAKGKAAKASKPKATKPARQPWPKGLPEQTRAVRAVLNGSPGPMDAQAVAKHFARADGERVEELLETLTALGQARRVKDGWVGV